jgi:hypothetical protein
MSENEETYQKEINDLQEELKHFKEEKERVRKIVGQIGEMPTFRTKLVNLLFIVIIAISIIVSFFAGKEWRLVMIEVTAIALSVKIIYLMHCQGRVNHFKLWVLSSIEWRLNEVDKRVRQIDKNMKG